MKTISTVAAIIILFAAQPSQTKKRDGASESHVASSTSQTNKPNDASDQPPSSVSVTVNNLPPSPNGDGDKQQSKGDADTQQRPADYTGLLVLVGIVTAGFIWWQALETRRSVQAIRDSLPFQRDTAEAALQNAQALIKAERPWIFLTIDPKSFQMQPTDRLDWRIANNGRTVANITEGQIRCRKIGVDKPLEPQPDYGGGVISFYDAPVAPSGRIDAWCGIETGRERRFTTEDAEDIKTRGYDLVAFGFVKYKDQFGQNHESRFCYWYAVAFQEFRIYLRAPAEYHRCT